MNRSILFSGCAVERAGVPARQATMALARALHLELWEAPAAGCCGACADRPADAADLRQVLAPLAAAAERRLGMVCLSPGCARVVAAHLADAVRGEPVAEPAALGPQVHDCLGLLTQAFAVTALERALTNRVSALRVAPHAHCHGDHRATRVHSTARAAANTMGGEGGGASGGLAALLELAGATVLDDVSAAGNCASSQGEDTSAMPCLTLAAEAGAGVLVTPCFLCFANLNRSQQQMHQGDAARAVPVLHLAQLLGLACGAAPLSLGLARTTVSARSVLLPFVVRV
jgi:succinate dehydrogenase cytochrome b subunit